MPEVLTLQHDLFLQTFASVPRLAICLHVEDAEGKVLLTQRAIEPEKGSWHYPGSFLLKNEALNDCVQRVALRELDVAISGQPELLGVFEDLDADPRGHVVDVVYRVRLTATPQSTTETEKAQFFAALPSPLAFHHDRILKSLGYHKEEIA